VSKGWPWTCSVRHPNERSERDMQALWVCALAWARVHLVSTQVLARAAAPCLGRAAAVAFDISTYFTGEAAPSRKLLGAVVAQRVSVRTRN
jgi:hypothetical protein